MRSVRRLPSQVVVTALAATMFTVLAAPAAQGAASAGRRETARVTWSSRKGPVPGVRTASSPAQASVAFPGNGNAPGALLFWAGAASRHHEHVISYEHAISVDRDKWSPPKTVDGGKAATDLSPSAASFTSGSAHDVIVTWKGGGSTGKIWYSIGIAEQGGTLLWGPAFAVPGALTAASPAVFSPLHSGKVFLSWRVAGGSRIGYLAGSTTSTDPLKWGPARILPGARTTGSPDVTEASAGPAKGRLYVLWRTAAGSPGGSGRIAYATTADPLAGVPRWSVPVSLRRGIMTGATPAAQAIGHDATWPLLIVYRHGSMLEQVTMTESGTLSNQQAVPFLVTHEAPSLFGSILAVTLMVRVYYVRACSGC